MSPASFFAEQGAGEITTQQIADKADIGTGTLFLYVRSKDSNDTFEAIKAIKAIFDPLVACNRTQVVNGRPHLKEMDFGDHEERHHCDALDLSAQPEVAIHIVLRSDQRLDPRSRPRSHTSSPRSCS